MLNLAIALALAAPLAAATVDGRKIAVFPDGQVEVRAGSAEPLRYSLGEPLGSVRIERAATGAIINGAVGRDGERTVTLEIGDQDVLRYQTAPGVTRCDGEKRLFVERYSDSWHSFPCRCPQTPCECGPRPRPRPACGPRRCPCTASSPPRSRPGLPRRADLLTPPQELADGRADTAWRAPFDARGAWVTARSDAPDHAVSALRIVPATQKDVRRPQTLAAIFADGQTVLFDLLPGPQWVSLPRPAKSPCVSLVIVATAAQPGQDTGLGEVGIYSELEAAGAAGLVRQVTGSDSGRAEEAMRVLLALAETQPGPVLDALATALAGKLEDAARRRLQLALTRLPRGGQDKALAAALGQALAAAAAAERPPLWQALDRLGAAADGVILELTQGERDPDLRAAALERLGRRGAFGALWERRRREADPPLRRALTAGLAAALRCRKPDDPNVKLARQALAETWHGTEDLLRAADLLSALGQAAAPCRDREVREHAAITLARAWQGLDEYDAKLLDADAAFLVRYRILQGLVPLGVATPAVVNLLNEVLLKGRDPDLRLPAARAAAALPFPDHGELGRRGLADSDTGVRLAALSALSGHRDAATGVAIEQALSSDHWPQVRRAAAQARAAACPAGGTAREVPELRRALRDPDLEVRRLALSGIAHCEGKGAAPLLSKLARDAAAHPELRGQSCALLATVLGRQAQPVLAAVLADALKDPAADDRHAALAMTCARSLGRAGDVQAVPALLQAAGEPASPAVRLAAIQSLGQLCSSDRRVSASGDVRTGLQAARKDPDPQVAAAARAAAARCKF